MVKIAVFVDGSNLFGSLKMLDVHVENYERFYGHILKEAVRVWKSSFISDGDDLAQLGRIYWYEVGTMDERDLENTSVQNTLKEQFLSNAELKRLYFPIATQDFRGDPKLIPEKAWTLLFSDIKDWYNQKSEQLSKSRQFHHAIRSGTDFIDLIACGHLKVNLLGKGVEEKGIDTALAVDMVRLADTYDVALVITGDADSIPSIEHIKSKGKHVGVIEFIKGHPPEKKGRQTSSRLKSCADFVVQIYETNLSREGITTPVDRHTPRSH